MSDRAGRALEAVAWHAAFAGLFGAFAYISAWREPKALSSAVAAAKQKMLGKRQLEGWNADDAEKLVADLSTSEGLELYRRYTSVGPTVAFSAYMTALLATGLKAFTWVPGTVALALPGAFFVLNVVQDGLISLAIAPDTPHGMSGLQRLDRLEILGALASNVTRAKFGSLVAIVLAAPTTVGVAIGPMLWPLIRVRRV